ncbi:MAG: glycosyltransferase family 4 protein [Anaerolineae bacterium]|nr:glycosyltransferase family 4 protein [Anaerolineae bacterium]
MRVLLVHNHYGSEAPSGENQVFALERAMLESHGHEVQVYERHSDEIRGRGAIGMIQGALATPWNPATVRRVRRLVQQFRPQVVHVHNTFPLISNSVFSAIGADAARVLTLHNYRLFCSAAIPMREGRVCTECIDARSVLPAVRHGCYRGSRVATLPIAASVALHRWRGTWQREVEAFIALTEFQRRVMVDGGLPADALHVKPNFYPGWPEVTPWNRRVDRIVFVGRLSAEKGVSDLLSAWMAWGAGAPELVLIGDGPLRADLEERASASSVANVRFVGQVGAAEAQRWIAEARLLILPSICFEGFPMVVREALAFGTPCAVSNIGPLPDIAANGEAGAIFRAREPAHLLETVRALWADPERLRRMGGRGRREFEAQYTEHANYERLMAIYQRAIALRQTRRIAQ